MKGRQLYRMAVTILTMTLTMLMLAGQCLASPAPGLRGNSTTPSENPPIANVTQAQSGQEKAQASAEEVERFRAELIEFVRAYRDLALTISPRHAQKFDGIEEQLLRLPTAELSVLRSGMADTSLLRKTTRKLRDSVDKTNLLRASNPSLKSSIVPLNSVGFPDADYPSCGTTRVDDSVIDASDTALFVAEGVRDAASRGCGQVAVVAGFGANTSTACIITDGVYLAAKIINYGLHYCNDKIDAAEQGATYTRLTHLHADLDTSIANDAANTSSILSQVNASEAAVINNSNLNKGLIIANDNANKTAIVDNDNNNKAAIIANDNANKTAIVDNANSNKGDIVTNDNANTATITNAITAAKIELRDLILRTQIEADLSQNEGNTPVALFETPTANGGYLDLVQTIVTQTLARIQAAGGGISNAQQFLTKANEAKAAGQFKTAYDLYRKAYKAAAK